MYISVSSDKLWRLVKVSRKQKAWTDTREWVSKIPQEDKIPLLCYLVGWPCCKYKSTLEKTTFTTPSTWGVMHQSMWKCKHIRVVRWCRYEDTCQSCFTSLTWWRTQKGNMITKYRCSYTSPMYIFINIYLQFLWITFINFELCGVGLDTAIKKILRNCITCIWDISPPQMATYQDGRIWRRTLNPNFKRLNAHDWMCEKQEINGCMCWMTLPDVHPISPKTSCPEYFKCKQIIIGLCACADLLYTKMIVHFRWDYVTTASSYIDGYLNKAIWNLRIGRLYAQLDQPQQARFEINAVEVYGVL